MQEFLDILLLQIIHRAVSFLVAVAHEEFQDLFAAEKAAPGMPGKGLAKERCLDAQHLHGHKAGAGDADGARTVIESVLVIDNDRGLAMMRQRQRRDHADRAGPDNGHRRGCRQPRARWRGEDRIVEIERVPPPLAMRFHAPSMLPMHQGPTVARRTERLKSGVGR